MSIKYFLVAILFVLFDVEVIFIYPWAVNFKELGREGMIEQLVHFYGYAFAWLYLRHKKGALDFLGLIGQWSVVNNELVNCS